MSSFVIRDVDHPLTRVFDEGDGGRIKPFQKIPINQTKY